LLLDQSIEMLMAFSLVNKSSINKCQEKLEKELAKPVISSNTATLWAMLKKLGYHNLFNEMHTRIM